MKQLFPAFVAFLILFSAACGNEKKQDENAYDTLKAKDAAAARQNELTASNTIDYAARHAYAVVSPDGDQMWVIRSRKEQAIASFQAEAISDDQWNIRFKGDERRTVMVNWVDNAAAFAAVYPTLMMGVHVVFDSAQCTTVPAVTEENAKCVELRYICYKRMNTEYRTCKEINKPNECHGIWTKVGWERHYGGSNCNPKNKIQDVDLEDWVCAW